MLLQKIRHVYAGGNDTAHLLPDQGIVRFMEHCSSRIGDAYFRTPRTTITAFIDLLAVLEQNPGTDWTALIGGVDIKTDNGGLADLAVESEADEDLAAFRL